LNRQLNLSGNGKLQSRRGHSPTEKPRCSRPGASTIEARTQTTQQLGFPGQRGGFIGTFLELDPLDGTQQPQMPAGHPVRVGHPIAGEPFPQVLGLADVEYRVGSVAHQVTPRTPWCSAEEF